MMIHEVLDKHYKGRWKTFPSPTSTIDDFENIVWIGNPPTRSEFKVIYEAEQKAFNDAQYQRDRKYPEIGEQLDKLFHDIDQGKLDKNGGFFKALKAIKDAHPKG